MSYFKMSLIFLLWNAKNGCCSSIIKVKHMENTENTNNQSNTHLNAAGQHTNHNMNIIYEECPVCYEENLLSVMCPNNHKLCSICLRHIQGIKNWRTNTATCPICRANIPYVPINPPNNNVIPAHVFNAPNPQGPLRNLVPARRGHGRPRGQEWYDALTEFINNKNNGTIPANAEFGGIHNRGCGNRQCNRVGGKQGVRFLIYGDSEKRRYRCELHTNA